MVTVKDSWFRIWFPPINLFSKFNQHAFDNRWNKKAMTHEELKQFCIENKIKIVEYNHPADDVWRPVLVETCHWSEENQYRLPQHLSVNYGPDIQETYAYKRGYYQALEDVKAQLDMMSKRDGKL